MRVEEFHLDERSGVPVYLQVRDQILHAIARGALRAGEQLPTVRELAVALTVNPNTVNRAYAELERDGVLTSTRGRGTFVTEHTRAAVKPHRAKLSDAAERFIAHARSLGFDDEGILRAIEAQLKRRT